MTVSQYANAARSLCRSVKNLAVDMVKNPRKHAVTFAGFFWTSSAVDLMFAKKLGGTWNESIGGGIITIGEVTALGCGSLWKYAGNFATTAFISGVIMERWPEIMSNPLLALGMLGLVAVNTPIMFEFGLKEPAQQALEKLHIQRQFNSNQSWDIECALNVKETVLWCYANPRTTSWGMNFSYLLTSITSDLVKHHFHMPFYLEGFYVGQKCGNRIAPFSERPAFETARKTEAPYVKG